MKFKPQQEYMMKSKYARYLDDKKRRENWDETVDRYFNFAQEHISSKFPHAMEEWNKVSIWLRDSVYEHKTMPSMRLLMTAGEAARRNSLAIFNCAFFSINKKRKFSDALMVLMHGTGLGFSCERQEIAKLPTVPDEINKTDDVIVVKDSKEGWATAYYHLVSHLYRGTVPCVDYSKVRPKGARLKTFGGRASGPEPLQRLFEYTETIFRGACGRKLNSIEVHDILCMIADVVVVGGVVGKTSH